MKTTKSPSLLHCCLLFALLLSSTQPAFQVWAGSFEEMSARRESRKDVDQANATEHQAMAYIGQGRPREAEAILLRLLTELERNAPTNIHVGGCLRALARAYHADSQPALEGQCWYRAVQFARENDTRGYVDVLYYYEMFLLKQKMYKEAAPVADQFMVTAWPEIGLRNRRPWEIIAQSFADVNEEESNKFYKASFDVLMQDPHPPL